MKLFPFIKREQMLIPVPGNQPIDYFRHLLTDKFIDYIVSEINEYAIEIFLGPKIKQKSRITEWKELTNEEFLVFIGLILHMGTIRLNRVVDYWKQDDLFNLAAFSKNMSRNRFLLIQRCLHFARNPKVNEDKSVDRLYKVRPLITFFNERMDEIYYPGRELSLDESMILWRGRLVFRQYIKNKRHKFGIKLYMLTTPNGCILR
ncbi:piggyBac transposable element-derived protein 4-like, partial [Diabrotica virgifera virgifera]|uniref:PiggyBac transposable element-derived protein domain-containing protein n=1 Tax=Diabrotica virgifera virgifera TaxID=50390 RepID=A0ABM5L7S8_DIAVI